MSSPFAIIEEFEAAICAYTGAPYAVAVNACTNALFLSLMYYARHLNTKFKYMRSDKFRTLTIPKRTYVSVPMQCLHAGFKVEFDDVTWKGMYRLFPSPIWDCARRFTGGMYTSDAFMCVSFHWTKPLGIQHGGAILHDDQEADEWLCRARFDGRLSGEPASAAKMIGWHCLTTPEIAAAGLVRIANLPKNNPDAPKPNYPDLSRMEIFK
jgi:dTDP-4-amino-4,6-dideoxygalactose transaminase